MSNFYSRLSYSFGNEDWKTEQKALRIQPHHRLLCITASGDRPLNLLSQELTELVSIDTNPMQNALFDLKRAALKKLDYSDYLAFLGATPHPNRLKTFSQLEPELSSTSIALWSRHPHKIAQGVLYEGAVEKCLHKVSKALRLLRGDKIDGLFSCTSLPAQRLYLKEHWHTALWKATFHITLHPWVFRILLNDPGLYAYVDHDIHIGKHFYNKLHGALHRFLAKESMLLSLIFRGVVEKEHFPPYLTSHAFHKIKRRLDRVSYQTTDMHSFLEKTPANHFDGFSCSDIASYMSKENFDKIVRGIVRTAKPGARFCIRQFLSKHQIPADLIPHLRRDFALEKELEQEDRCFVYSFLCGTIRK